MKRLLSVFLCVFVLMCSFPSFASSWIDDLGKRTRPAEEVELIKTYLDTLSDGFESSAIMGLMCQYYDNVDIVGIVFTLKNVSSRSLTAQYRKQLEDELLEPLTVLHGQMIENFVQLGVEGVKVVVFCNTNDYSRIFEIWDERINPTT